MRKSLGSVILLFLFCVHLVASEYSWSVESSKKEAYVNEAIYLKYTCQFSDRAELYSIEFNPLTDNETYKIELFSESIKLVDGKKINIYEFIAYVKKPMVLQLPFEALMKKTNQASIENTVLGRDNMEKEEFSITPVKLEALELTIQESLSKSVGHFSINIIKDTQSIKAYEPYHLEIILSGEGNFDSFSALDFTIENVKTFTQKPLLELEHTTNGTKGKWSQKFAFVGKEDFTIPPITLDYFDLTSKKLQQLEMESVEVKVQEVYKKSQLLDEEEEIFTFDFSYLYYVLTFLAGFLLAKVKFKSKTLDTKNTQLRDKIQNVGSLDALSMLLILNNQRKFNAILTSIDSKELTSLSQAKKQAIKLLENS